LNGLAKTWPAYKKWSYRGGGSKYLSDIFGDSLVKVYVDKRRESYSNENFSGYSFEESKA